MTFFQLVREEMQGSLRWLLFMSALGGVSNAAILAAVNAGSKLAGESKPGLSSAILFIVALILFIKTQHYILITVTVEIESIIHRLRVRLMDALRRSELLALGAIGRTQIVAAITKETAALAEAARMLAFAGQGVVLLFFVSLYIAYLSLTAFFLSVLIVGFALLVFRARSAQISIEARETAECENRLFDRLGDLLDGFKEVRLNRSRSDDLFAEFRRNVASRCKQEDFHAGGNVQENGVCAGVRLFVVGNRCFHRAGPEQGHGGIDGPDFNSSLVCGRDVFRHRSVHARPLRGECCGREYRTH